MGTIEFGKAVVNRALQLNDIERGVYVTPFIEVDTKQLAKDVTTKELLFVCSASALPIGETVKVGMACSLEKFYYANKNGQTDSFRFCDVHSLSFNGKNRFGTYSAGDEITVTMNDGRTHILGECLLGFDCIKICDFLEFAGQSATATDGGDDIYCLSLEELHPSLQINYMETLYNYAYLSDLEVDSTEYAALQSITVRLGLTAETRKEIKDYLFLLQQGTRTKTGVLIHRCVEQMSFGTYEIFRFSMMQDILYIRAAKAEEGMWFDDPFINGLQQMLEITDQQIELMIHAIELHKESVKKDCDLQKLQKQIRELISSAKALRIPAQSIFCSGSPYNIDTYWGIHRAQKLNRSITAQRELMLQAVIRNTQESINFVVEELNDTTLRLVNEVASGNERQTRIKELTDNIIRFQAQMKSMGELRKKSRISQLYNGIRKAIDPELFLSLDTRSREIVRMCYRDSAENGYIIRDDLSERELATLHRIEELIEIE